MRSCPAPAVRPGRRPWPAGTGRRGWGRRPRRRRPAGGGPARRRPRRRARRSRARRATRAGARRRPRAAARPRRCGCTPPRRARAVPPSGRPAARPAPRSQGRAYDRPVPDDDPRSRVFAEPPGAAARRVELPKGDVTDGVVRGGGTVRRPHQPTSIAVAGYLDHLERAGFEGAPRYLGRDAQGRDVLTYLEGSVAGDPPEPWATSGELLVSVARLLRRLHDASTGYLADAGFAAPYGGVWHRQLVRVDAPGDALPPPELVSHCDVTPQNVVVRGGRAVGLVDFDM